MLKTFDAIVQAARDQDEDALKLALGNPPSGSLDSFLDTTDAIYSPTDFLINEKNHKAVEFLRLRGANVHKIAQYYAVVGDLDKVEEYRTKHNASVDEIATGFASAKNIKEVDRYRNHHKANEGTIAYGYAVSGHLEEAEACRVRGAPVDLIAEALGVIGNVEKAMEYHRQYGASIDKIAKGAAIGGHTKIVDDCYTQYQANENEIANGFALVGNLKEADRYRIDYAAHPDFIIHGLAAGGHFELLRQSFGAYGNDIDQCIDGLDIGLYEEEKKRYEDFKQKVLRYFPAPERQVDANKVLLTYAKSCFARPIPILEDDKYLNDYRCVILQDIPSIPVRVYGDGPYDLAAVLMSMPRHPLRQDCIFSVNDIAPDYVTRSALVKIAEREKSAKRGNSAEPVDNSKRSRFTPGYDAQDADINPNNSNSDTNKRTQDNRHV